MRTGSLLRLDVAILGGGPAGCAAAIRLAQAGKSVGIFERSSNNKDRVGEVVPPEIHRYLHMLGLWEKFQRDQHLPLNGITSRWGSNVPTETDSIFNPVGHGWVLDREVFDRMLASSAIEVGALLYRGSRVFYCERKSKSWQIEAKSANGIQLVTAEWIINAAGRIASIKGIDCGRLMSHPLIAAARYLPSKEETPAAGCRLRIETTCDGWWYSVRLPRGRVVVAHLTDANCFVGKASQREMLWNARWRDTAMSLGLPSPGNLAPLRYCPASTSRARFIAGDSWIAIGDAAVGLDPLSGHGILQALRSALDAANAIAAPAFERANRIEKYVQEESRRFDEALQLANAYYRAERRWPSSEFWSRRFSST
jgi:flavin-dependent dehydrogenase